MHNTIASGEKKIKVQGKKSIRGKSALKIASRIAGVKMNLKGDEVLE